MRTLVKLISGLGAARGMSARGAPLGRPAAVEEADAWVPSGPCVPELADPGTAPWAAVRADQAHGSCALNPEIPEAIQYQVPWLVVRHGKACWAAAGALADAAAQNFSATKPLGAAPLGMVAYDRDALLAHVLGMEADNLSCGPEQQGHHRRVRPEGLVFERRRHGEAPSASASRRHLTRRVRTLPFRRMSLGANALAV